MGDSNTVTSGWAPGGRTQPFKVRTGCGHVVIRRMREETAGITYTEGTIIEAPNGQPCKECGGIEPRVPEGEHAAA